MSEFYENSIATSPIGPRSKTLAEFEYKRILNKPLKDVMYKAVSSENFEKLKEILDTRKDINLEAQENRAFAKLLLDTAIENDDDKILEVLINKGARIGGILFTAVRQGSYKSVKCIVNVLEAQGSVDDQFDLGPSDSKTEGFITPLMMAIQLNDYDIIEYLIIRGYKVCMS